MRFKDFIKNESYAIFGYDDDDGQKDIKHRSPNFAKDDMPQQPMKRLDVNYAINLLTQTALGEKQPQRLFFDTVRWGEGPGAIRLRFGTRYQVVIERLNYDLKGEPIWIAKRVFDINLEQLAGRESSIAYELTKALHEVDEGELDGPSHDYGQFERLVRAVAYQTGRVVNDPLFFEEVKKVNDNEYIVKFGVRGHGVQARNQKRVELVEIHLRYHQDRGIIKAYRANVESRLGNHDWSLQPSDFEFTFAPAQAQDEIISTLSTVMKYY